MPKRTSYAQGTPSWVDLQTTDPEAAKSFYGSLFDWTFQEFPMPDGFNYSMAFKNGESAAGIAPQPPQVAAMGIPSTWNTYLAVDDVDAAAKRSAAAGGTSLMEPMDVMDSGRMCFVADPSGAAIGLWEAKGHIGATIVNEPGALIWNELQSNDQEAALAFYADVVGIETEAMDMDGMAYTLIKVGGEMVGGAMKPAMEGVPSHWHVYFSVTDIAAGTAQATKLGATLIAGPFDTSIGKMAVIKDPQGAFCSFFEAKAS